MSPLKQRSQRKKIGFDIKNSDRNGPEGQFITASTTMCNAGSPLYNRVCLSSPVSIKVSMKKKRKEAVQEQGAWPKFYSCNQLVCARLQIPDLEVGRQRSGAVRSGACSSRQAWGPGSPSGLVTYSAGGMGGSKDAPHFESSFHGRLAGASGRAVSKVHEPKRVDCAGC